MGILAAFAAGCGGDDGISVDTTEHNVCSEYAEVACHDMYNCCTEGEIENRLSVSEPRTQAECREDLERACIRSTALISDSIKAGRMRFEAETMNNCLESYVAPENTCAEIVTELPWKQACLTSAFVGNVQTDGACFLSTECAGYPDSTCGANQKCTPKPGHGMPCGTGCASAFYCSVGLCVPKLPAGGVCNSGNECQKELFCDFNATPMPVCTAPGDAGATCKGSSSCKSGTCVPGTCSGTTNQTCYQDLDCGGRCADDNSSCSNASQCAIGSCQMTGFSCTTPTQCGITDTCVFPVQCIPGDCIGDPVCTEPHLRVDYCTAIGSLPGI